MKKWEYLLVYYSSNIFAEVLNDLGAKGWELIQTIQTIDQEDAHLYRWIFKREKVEAVNADITD